MANVVCAASNSENDVSAPERRRCLLERFNLTRRNANFRALVHKLTRDGEPDAAASPCNDGNPPLETSVHDCLSILRHRRRHLIALLAKPSRPRSIMILLNIDRLLIPCKI